MVYKVNFDIELKKNPYKGLYIAIEGIDGSGKTTQVEKLAEHFKKLGREVVKTHEPRRDGVIGKLVSDVLTKQTSIPKTAIQYLFAAQRATFLEELIIPALERGAVVVSDRCFWSAVPYGLLDKFESEHEESADQLLAALSILSMYHEFIAPDYTVYLDVSASIAGERISQKGDAELYEVEEKIQKIRDGYEFLLDKFDGEFSRISGSREVEKVTADIIKSLPEKSS